MSAAAAKANNNRQQQATSKASYAGPTATEEARAAAKKVRNQGAECRGFIHHKLVIDIKVGK